MDQDDDDDPIRETERYVDRIFGSGMGRRHVHFLDRIAHSGLREMIHRYHALEADTAQLSLEENHLIGLCVLSALGRHETAGMFAKTLLHLGTPKEKILEATARLSMWIGGLPAVDATFRIQRALAEYEREGLGSLAAWLPAEGGQ
jgi:alkylhydroperoxidase/carboxymuconolactone decarboxylase family protein YurZ